LLVSFAFSGTAGQQTLGDLRPPLVAEKQFPQIPPRSDCSRLCLFVSTLSPGILPDGIYLSVTIPKA
jgi:hypothetical protein